MPAPKKATKKSDKTTKKVVEKTNQEIAHEKINQMTDEVISKAKELKVKFDKVDSNTKQKIAAGLTAAAGTLIALAKLKKHVEKKKANPKK
ncbi:MAG: hypothetical protein PF572_06145 [Patescibacteria group bacterium]|jgi:hypothetical protein|nr:hypothetical protein [Patescibacteria group bacterium]